VCVCVRYVRKCNNEEMECLLYRAGVVTNEVNLSHMQQHQAA